MHLQHTSSDNECIITFANFYEFFESAMEKKKNVIIEFKWWLFSIPELNVLR